MMQGAGPDVAVQTFPSVYRGRCIMTRFLLAVTVWSYVITPIALFADDPENCASAPHASAKSAPVYVKILLPNDPAPRVVEKDSTVVEAWITKSIENRNKANFTA